MVKVKEKLERFNMADPTLTVEEAVQFMVDHFGNDPQVAKIQVLRSRKKGPISDYVFTLPDGTKAVRVI
jgi:hypothetical protein